MATNHPSSLFLNPYIPSFIYPYIFPFPCCLTLFSERMPSVPQDFNESLGPSTTIDMSFVAQRYDPLKRSRPFGVCLIGGVLSGPPQNVDSAPLETSTTCPCSGAVWIDNFGCTVSALIPCCRLTRIWRVVGLWVLTLESDNMASTGRYTHTFFEFGFGELTMLVYRMALFVSLLLRISRN